MLAIVDTPLDVRSIEASVRADGYGGLATFCGIVRERADDGRLVTGLTYEAHETMALAAFEKIAVEAKARFGDLRVALVHRIGLLEVGDIAVVVAVGCPHRAEAFDACEYAIDELKARAAIWKKELYVNGDGEWIANRCRVRESKE